MSYADDKTDKELAALEEKVSKVYTRTYKQARATANEYFKSLEPRYKQEFTSMMASTNSFDDFAKWYRENRDATSNDAAIKTYWQRNQHTYTEASFKQWYATQVSRGERYEKMADDIAKRMTKANEVAVAYINDETPSIYSLNRNYTAYQISGMVPGASFEIYNEQAVKNLIMDNRNVTEFRTLRVNPVRDYEWNSRQIKNVLASGIIRGLSIDNLADEFLTVMQRNRAAAIRNARTAVTGAQNAGRLDTMNAAENMGIEVKKQWHSMEDARVRHTHAMLNGQIRDKNKPFGNGLMYPGDSKGAPAEVYNCRCRMEYILPKYMDSKSTDTYDKWDKLSPEQKKAEEAKYNAWVKSSNAKAEEQKKIKITREERKSIIERGIKCEKPIFCEDTTSNQYASMVKYVLGNKAGFYDVAMHGNGKNVQFFGQTIDADTLAQIIFSRKDYKRGTPIRLLSCSTGAEDKDGDCIARWLADTMNVDVLAPTDDYYLEIDNYGKLHEKVGVLDDGYFKTFNPIYK